MISTYGLVCTLISDRSISNNLLSLKRTENSANDRNGFVIGDEHLHNVKVFSAFYIATLARRQGVSGKLSADIAKKIDPTGQTDIPDSRISCSVYREEGIRRKVEMW